MPDILESGNVGLSFSDKELMKREEKKKDDKSKNVSETGCEVNCHSITKLRETYIFCYF